MNYTSNKKTKPKVLSPVTTPLSFLSENILEKSPVQKESQCVICNKSTKLYCSNCSKVYYCGEEHQRLHW